jgi:hypothetical protein
VVRRLALASAAVASLLLVPPLAAPAPSGGAPAAGAFAAKNKKKCRRGQIKVKVGKRRTACRPFKKAFPKPRPGDARLLVAESLVTNDWSHLRSRRGKRLPSLPKLIRRTGPRARAVLTSAVSRGLARIDALSAGASSSRTRASAAQAGCTGSLPATNEQITTGGGGGPSATIGIDTGPGGASLGIDLTGNGITISLNMDLGVCDPNEVEAPSCPTAAGQLDGRIHYKFKVAVRVSQGGEEVWSQAQEVTRRTKLAGFNEVDAKLDGLDVDDTETSTLRLGGSARGFPAITFQTRIVRRTHVDMRSGSYDFDRSQVEATISMAGLSGPDRAEAEEEFERQTQADADRQFGAVVEKAISGYRSREAGWQEAPNPCAEMKFNPVSNSRTLRPNDSGSFTVTVTAKSDGNQSELDGKLSETENAVFAPLRAGGQSARFDYSQVSGTAPPGSKVRVKVRATSKAGVAEARWEQPIEPPFEIDTISGNFTGSYTQPAGTRTARVTWNGGATFRRNIPAGFPGASGPYPLTAGQVTYHYSGGNVIGNAACDMRGSATVDIFQDGGGQVSVFAANQSQPFAKGPHDYGASASLGPEPTVTLTMENCAPGAESEEGKQYTIPIGYPPLDTGPDQQRSPDGIHYDGSYSASESGTTREWSWTLIGQKTNP